MYQLIKRPSDYLRVFVSVCMLIGTESVFLYLLCTT